MRRRTRSATAARGQALIQRIFDAVTQDTRRRLKTRLLPSFARGPLDRQRWPPRYTTGRKG